MKVKMYQELVVWQEAMKLAEEVYRLQKALPKEEVYGLGDQIRRAVVSIASNIAEGFGRDSSADFIHFLHIARGSLYETRTQLELAQRLGYFLVDDSVSERFETIARLINGLIRSLRTKHEPLTTSH